MATAAKTWGLVRGIYLAAGMLCAVVAAASFVSPSSTPRWFFALIALLVLWVPLFASDELIKRIHRIFWRREWPK
jgi:hypothetical protein